MRKANERSKAFREPHEVLTNLMAAGAELIRARDAALGAALDVPPPSVEPAPAPVSAIARTLSGDVRGLAYRGARKIYRLLKRIGPLRPLLQGLRDKIRRRL